MNKLIELFDSLIIRIMCGFTVTISISMLLIKAMYNFDDSPYFTTNTIVDLVILLFFIFLSIPFIKNIDKVEKFINIKIVTVIYFVFSILFLILVPLKLFSDMEQVFNGAVSISKLDFEEVLQSNYLQTFKGNINLSYLYGIIMMILPKSVWTLKVLNIAFNLGTSFLAMKVIEQMNLKYSHIAYVITLFFLPVFLYLNHIYFDNMITFITLYTFYIYTKSKENIIIVLSILAFASAIRLNSLVLVIAYIIDYLLFYRFKLEYIKKCILGILSVIIIFLTLGAMVKPLHNDSMPGYSGWNQFYIGINDKEFGFMDGDFSFERDFEDVLHRYQDYGVIKISKIMIKKFFWTWGEGTYQASRYSFGENQVDYRDKFLYSSPVTKYVMTNEQLSRKFTDALCRVEYMLLFFFMTGFVVLNIKKNLVYYRTIYLMFIGTLFILLFYEMKSRYIFNLYPFMIILAIASLTYIKIKFQSLKIMLNK